MVWFPVVEVIKVYNSGCGANIPGKIKCISGIKLTQGESVFITSGNRCLFE
jgi:hypothetical protein